MITILKLTVDAEADNLNVVFRLPAEVETGFQMLEIISESMINNFLSKDAYIDAEWFNEVYMAIKAAKPDIIDHFKFTYNKEEARLTAAYKPYQDIEAIKE